MLMKEEKLKVIYQKVGSVPTEMFDNREYRFPCFFTEFHVRASSNLNVKQKSYICVHENNEVNNWNPMRINNSLK